MPVELHLKADIAWSHEVMSQATGFDEQCLAALTAWKDHRWLPDEFAWAVDRI